MDVVVGGTGGVTEGPADVSGAPEQVPARILNEYVYCPRLAYLMWADKEFRHNAMTLDGTLVHRRVDRPRGKLAEPQEEPPEKASSIWLSSDRLSISAKIDLVERVGQIAVPIEYKRGSPIEGSVLHDPELVQLAAQVLLLRDAGFTVPHAEVYFATTRTRHRIEMPDALLGRVIEVADEVRRNAAREQAPPRLVDSPKCPHCVLVGLCLPDEVGLLEGSRERPARRLVARDSPARALYLTEQRARLTKRRGRLVYLVEGEEVDSVRLIDIAHIAVFGNAMITSSALRACFDEGVPVIWLTFGGWLSGHAGAVAGGSVRLRMRQHRAAMTGEPFVAGALVAGKIRNSRTLLRRHVGADVGPALGQLSALAQQAARERRTASLLGIEGTAARIYFGSFGRLLRPKDDEFGTFDFSTRNRRPPTDRVNALLSFLYSMLIKEAVVALLAAGLDPYVGLFHRVGFGRPSLALDLVEEFRPLVADSAVVRMINNGEIRSTDFLVRSGAVSMTDRGRRATIAAFEHRIGQAIRHPLFGYTTTYRRALEIQARLLGAVLMGEIPEYRPLTTR